MSVEESVGDNDGYNIYLSMKLIYVCFLLYLTR